MTDQAANVELLPYSVSGDVSPRELMPLIYDELRALTAAYFAREDPDHTLQPTAVVNEAYLRLIDQTRVQWQGRAHFFGVAAVLIRRILVDYARTRSADKRGGGRSRVALSIADPPDLRAERPAPGENGVLPGSPIDIEAIDAALHELAELSERQARVVELRFFGGLSVEETAVALGVSDRTVKADWRFARAWLYDRLKELR